MKTSPFIRCLAAVVVLMCAAHASADTFTDPAFNRFRSQVVGNNINFSYSTGGTPLAGGASSAGTNVAGGIDVSRGLAVATKHGPIAGSLSQRVSNAAMGKAFARAGALVGGPVGLAFLLLPSIVDWMTDAGVRPADAGGFEGKDISVCTESPCTGWKAGSYGPVATREAACALVPDTVGSPSFFSERNSRYVAGSSCTVDLYNYNTGAYSHSGAGLPLTSVSVPPSPEQYISIDAQGLEDRMSSVTPSPEALAELYKLGETVLPAHPIPDLVDTLRADFDARSPESVETKTTDSPSQTKTEEKTCATYTQVVGSTLSLVEDCSTTTTTQAKDPETGAPVGDPVVETETGSNTTPDPSVRSSTDLEPVAMACGVAGTPACSVKVDETGTPTGESFGDAGALDEAFDLRTDGLAVARDMAGDTSWGIVPAWTNDQACEPWDVFTLPEAIGGDVVTVDLCPLMPLAEGILNFIWVMLGIFAITSMVASAMTGKAA